MAEQLLTQCQLKHCQCPWISFHVEMEMNVLKGHFQMMEACGTVFYSVYVTALDGLS